MIKMILVFVILTVLIAAGIGLIWNSTSLDLTNGFKIFIWAALSALVAEAILFTIVTLF